MFAQILQLWLRHHTGLPATACCNGATIYRIWVVEIWDNNFITNMPSHILNVKSYAIGI